MCIRDSSVECISFVRDRTSDIDSSLQTVDASLPELVQACEQFGARATELVAERKTNRESLNCYTSLIELLEVPQLMDTCVRNGLYDEAIELLAFSRSIARIHPGIPVVVQVLTEVEESAETMVSQLLALLRTPLQLHVCLRVVAHIRRLKVFSPSELRTRFLQCRNQWLESEMRVFEIEQNLVTRLTKTADCIRTSMFEILTEFHAIFVDQNNDAEESSAMLFEWAGNKVACLLYTSDAADEEDSVDLGGRRIIKKKKKKDNASELRDDMTYTV
eukprot:TRINITY_DN40399_c0_g1_i1.p1 TRINITY_DN40399_c0_g1~~TRINITY_DN40399_c0_g1_i1.p1  ORF type:complete len:275 (+),score=76.49 TRINITY_DN40399_c0_g1_i1:81-905(+)